MKLFLESMFIGLFVLTVMQSYARINLEENATPFNWIMPALYAASFWFTYNY